MTRGADLRYDLTLTFEEAAFGTDTTLKIPRLEGCPKCAGSGSADGAPPKVCQGCGGRGQVRFTQGFFTVARTCPQCQGEGRVISDPVHRVPRRGAGGGGALDHRQDPRRGRHRRPPAPLGRGGARPPRRARRATSTSSSQVRPHKVFRRDGATVLSRQSISYPQAVLGTSVEIDTLHGKSTLDVPAGTQHGRDFRVRGQGIPRLDGSGKGDHVVTVEVEVPSPRNLSAEELQLLRRLAELGGHPVKEEKGVIERVKNLFGWVQEPDAPPPPYLPPPRRPRGGRRRRALDGRHARGADARPAPTAGCAWRPGSRPTPRPHEPLPGVELESEETVPDADWFATWRERAVPFSVGRTLHLDPREPEEAPPEVPDGRHRLRLPARAAFGTGSHESTSLALELLEDADVRGRRVLDVGTGTGVLAFAALLFGAR